VTIHLKLGNDLETRGLGQASDASDPGNADKAWATQNMAIGTDAVSLKGHRPEDANKADHGSGSYNPAVTLQPTSLPTMQKDVTVSPNPWSLNYPNTPERADRNEPGPADVGKVKPKPVSY